MAFSGAATGRLALQVLTAVCACWWMLYWLIGTFTKGGEWLEKIDGKVYSKFLGTDGVTFLFQIGTVLIISAAGFLALLFRRKRALTVRAKDKKARLNIWTAPVILRSPFGILTVGDLVFLTFLLGTMGWYFLKWTVKWSRESDASWLPGDDARWKNRIYVVGVMFGCVALIPIALLWIPVSRGSPILNVLGIPFERAVKYHIWIGLLAVWSVIAHGIITGWYYIEVHQVTTKAGLFSWVVDGIANIPGEIAWLAGIVMLFTALERVRRKSFDLFFIAHHLYLVFILFFAFHCAWCIDLMIVPILFFFLDRFMRAVQSRKAVDVLSAKVLRSGAIELTVAKPPSSTYHALSFLYIRLPSVSKLMWHPFSVASSPLDGTNQIVIYIKPLGEFTKNLHDILLSTNHFSKTGEKIFKCPFSFKMGLEGPYGSESVFYLRYKSLVLIAGGIGVTPFLAIIRDILHRYRLGHEYLPTNIRLIICVKNEAELHILDALAPNSIVPGYDDQVKLTIQAFVTQEEQEMTKPMALTTSKAEMESSDSKPNIIHDNCAFRDDDVVLYSSPEGPIQELPTVSSVGHAGWVFTTFAATYVSYFIIFGILSLKSPKAETSGPVRVMYYLVAMTASIVIFGGGVMLLWSIWDKRSRTSDAHVLSQASPSTSSPSTSPSHGAKKDLETAALTTDESIWREDITFGRRPSWREQRRDEDRERSVTGARLWKRSSRLDDEIPTVAQTRCNSMCSSSILERKRGSDGLTGNQILRGRPQVTGRINQQSWTLKDNSILTTCTTVNADTFNDLAKQYSGQDVGVMVSGLQKMQQDVASECRRHSLSRSSLTVFHYHSVSFDL